MADTSLFAEGRSAEQTEREWGAVPARRFASLLPGDVWRRPSGSQWSLGWKLPSRRRDEGQGVIALTVRRGRGVPPSQTPQWSAVRRAGLARLARAPSQEHASIPMRRYGAPLPLSRET